MSSSGLSSLSSPPTSSEDEKPSAKPTSLLKNGKLNFKKAVRKPPAPPRDATPEPPREPSPPHEYVLADNPDIAFIVMFRSRFSEAFPRNVPNVGPQDIEQGIVDAIPGQCIENLLCALLVLVLNRKKPIERGHHTRALEEAVTSQRPQWPNAWQGTSPLAGATTFDSMNPTQRLTLLKTLAMWSLNTSEVIGNIIKDAYKQTRQAEDKNQPLAVQPWGTDTSKRRYWLIEGQHDAPFRLYRQSASMLNETWWSVAGTIDELKAFGSKLMDEKSQAARRLADGIAAAIHRLEATEEKRRRKEYRQSRKAAFARPAPGYSMYEGRTRGKRKRYTFSEDESEDDLDESHDARSSRRLSGGSTAAATTVTASGRQVKSRFVRSYGEVLPSGAANLSANGANGIVDDDEDELASGEHARLRRSARDQANGAVVRRPRASRKRYDDSDEASEEDERDASSTGGEWDGGSDDDDDGKFDNDDDDEEEENMSSDAHSDDSLLDSVGQRQLVVKLQYRKREKHVSGDVEGRPVSTLPSSEELGMGLTSDHNAHQASAAPAPQSNIDPIPSDARAATADHAMKGISIAPLSPDQEAPHNGLHHHAPALSQTQPITPPRQDIHKEPLSAPRASAPKTPPFGPLDVAQGLAHPDLAPLSANVA